MNPPELTILTADTDAACDPETGTCTISQTPIPSPGVAPVNRRSPSGHGGDPKALHPRTLEEAISQLKWAATGSVPFGDVRLARVRAKRVIPKWSPDLAACRLSQEA